MSTMKLIIASITVSASTRAARAPFIVPFTASAIWAFVAVAMYRGMLAAAVAACSAALQLVSRSLFALATESEAESAESWSRNAMKRRERIG